MNTMGKTLVIINFIFALLMLAFVATVAVTGTNWHKYADDLKDELAVARENTGSLGGTKKVLMTELQQNYARIEKLEKDFDALKEKARQDVEKEKKNTEDAKKKGDAAISSALLLTGTVERLNSETAFLNKTLGDRNKLINENLEKITKIEDELQVARNDRDRALARATELEAHNQELYKKHMKTLVTSNQGNAPIVKDANEPNPPPAFVKGVIEKVDERDRSLVQLSIGTDSGVGKDNTLEAYRLLPRPEYLGLIRIVDATPHKSIGRLIRVNRAGVQSELKAGDEVASQIR
jgi:hypothetical protein